MKSFLRPSLKAGLTEPHAPSSRSVFDSLAGPLPAPAGRAPEWPRAPGHGWCGGGAPSPSAVHELGPRTAALRAGSLWALTRWHLSTRLCPVSEPAGALPAGTSRGPSSQPGTRSALGRPQSVSQRLEKERVSLLDVALSWTSDIPSFSLYQCGCSGAGRPRTAPGSPAGPGRRLRPECPQAEANLLNSSAWSGISWCPRGVLHGKFWGWVCCNLGSGSHGSPLSQATRLVS